MPRERKGSYRKIENKKYSTFKGKGFGENIPNGYECVPQVSKSSEFQSSSLITVILDDSVLVKKDDKGVLFLLDSRICEKGYVGDVGFLDHELGGVLSKVSKDKNIPIVLMGDSIRSSEDFKNVALGGNADLDLLFWIGSNLRAHIDSPDRAAFR